MAFQSQQLHFVMVPLPCPGHLIPKTDMARLFAQRGVIITIITTPLNVIRIKPIINRAIDSGLPIRLVQLQLPLHEAGLPEGCENIDTVPSRGLFRNFFDAVSKLQQPLEQLLEEMEPSPSCIIADKNLAWTGDIATKFHIPRILFDGTSCFNLLCCHNILASKVNESASVSDLEPFVVPGLPDRIELTRAQLPTNLNTSLKDFKDLHEKINAFEGAYGVMVNSFVDWDQNMLKGIVRQMETKGVLGWFHFATRRTWARLRGVTSPQLMITSASSGLTCDLKTLLFMLVLKVFLALYYYN